MKSPIDGNPMEAVTLIEGLQAFRCKSSGGHYIPSTSYMLCILMRIVRWRWRF